LLVYQQRKAQRRGRRDAGAHPVPLPLELETVHTAATSSRLGRAPTVRPDPAHLRLRVRGYLAWLAAAGDVEGDPLTEPDRLQLRAPYLSERPLPSPDESQ